MPLVAGTTLGRYLIHSQLGAGGMGEVYRAKDQRLDREVAIKILPDRLSQDPTSLVRFQREARMIAAISHPNILGVFDIAVEEGRTYVVMEYLHGESLAQLLKNGPLPWRTTLELALPIAEGLAAAHARGIIHRDVKPANVFLTAEGVVKVLDFGLARLETKELLLTEPTMPTMTIDTQPGVLLGTVIYMSPEQVRGFPADARSDLFSFGCTLYEMLAGQAPFRRATNADTMVAILHESPESLAAGGDRPPELERIIARCLEKDAAKRYLSAHELVTALKAVTRNGVTDTIKARKPDTQVIAAAETGKVQRGNAASIAVLPFVNMSSDKENEYFSDGLAEELINVLSKIDGLQVASRTSTFAYKGKSEDARKIGAQLNVRTILEGSVRKSGNRLRIAAQLVSVADGYQLWSESYNRQLEDVFAIQDEIAQSIAKALRLVLTDKAKQALEKAPTADVQAYDLYLRGRQAFHQFRRQGFHFASDMFTKAIAIDGRYARAYAGLADCHSLLCCYWETSSEHSRAADEASQQALALDGELPEAHVARGLAVSLAKRYDEARSHFEKAIRLNPNLFESYYFYGRTCQAQGRVEEAARLYEKAAELRPDDYQSMGHVAAIYLGLNRKQEAEEADRRAIGACQARLALEPKDARALYLGAISWCRLGDVQQGLDWARRALQMDPEEPVTLYNVACLYSLQEQVEQAVECLENAVKFGFGHKEWIENDADLNALHGNPRYQALLKKLNHASHA